MLSPDVDILGLDGRHIATWLELVRPPGAADGWLLVILEGGAPVAVIAEGAGRVAPGEVEWSGPPKVALRQLRRGRGAGFALALERGVLGDVFAEAEGRLRHSDDYTAQVLTVWRAIKHQSGRGLWLDPPLLELLPAVGAEPLQKTFDLLIPDGSSVVAYVFEDDGRAAACSLLARKERGQVTTLACHRLLEARLPEAELARSWRTELPRLLDAVAAELAPPALGLFADRSAVERVLNGPPDQLGRELRAGSIVLSPAPAWLLGLIGGAAAIGLASRGAKTVARFLPSAARDAAASVARSAGDRVRASGFDPFTHLGFDPLELLADLREIYRRP